MERVLFNSVAMYKFLDERVFLIQGFEWCPIIVKDNTFCIDGRKGYLDVDSKTNFIANLKTQSVLRLWDFLSTLDEQPITIGIHDDWLYIKEAIL